MCPDLKAKDILKKLRDAKTARVSQEEIDTAKTAGAKSSNFQPLLDGQPGNGSMVGKVIGKFRLERRLGEGAFGEVYQAVHTELKSDVAIKILSEKVRDDTEGNEMVQRFKQEAQLVASIKHENVVSVTDFGKTEEGNLYLVMEYLKCKELGSAIQEGPMGLKRAKNIILQVCHGLEAAHALGIVHRDMKPENVLLTEYSGKTDFVKLIDFGIAKIIDERRQIFGNLTQAGVVFGTPKYMSPEQVRGESVDERSDIYSVGVIFYEMLCGRPPFIGSNHVEIWDKHRHEKPKPPSELRPDLGLFPEINQMILKALEKKKEDRFRSMQEFEEAIANIGKNGLVVSSPGTTADIKKPKTGLPTAPSTSVPRQTIPPGESDVDPEGKTISLSLVGTSKEGRFKIEDLEGTGGRRQIRIIEIDPMTGKETTLVKHETKGKTEIGKLSYGRMEDGRTILLENGKPFLVNGQIVFVPDEIQERQEEKSVQEMTKAEGQTPAQTPTGTFKPSYKEEVEAFAVGAVATGTICAMQPSIIHKISIYLSNTPFIGSYIASMDVPQQVNILGQTINSSDLVTAVAMLSGITTTLLVGLGIKNKKKGDTK